MKRLPLSSFFVALLLGGFFAFSTADAAAGGRRGGAPPRREAPAGLPGAMPGSIFAASDTIYPAGSVPLNFQHETVQYVLTWIQHNTYYTFLMSKDLPVGDISFSTHVDPTKPDIGMARADIIPQLEKLLADNGVTLVPMEGANILALPTKSNYAKVDVFAGRARPTPPPAPAGGNAAPPEAAPAPVPADADLTKLPAPSDRADLTFDKDIEPIFKASCVSCHATVNAAGAPRQASSKLDLTTLATALKGGAQGKDIVPGQADQSLLVAFTSGAVANTPMPPRGTPLTPEQVGLIMAWINYGAEVPEAPADATAALADAIAPAPAITPPAPPELTIPGMVGRPSMFQNVVFPEQPVNLTFSHPTDVSVVLKWLADNSGFTINAAPDVPSTKIKFYSTDYGQADITGKLFPGLPPAEVALGLERLLFVDGIRLAPDPSKPFALLAVPIK